MAIYKDLFIERGSHFSKIIGLENLGDLSDLKFKCQIKPTYHSDVYAELNVSVYDLETNKIELSLSTEKSLFIKPGRYVYDLLAASIDEETLKPTRIMEGLFIVDYGVSQW